MSVQRSLRWSDPRKMDPTHSRRWALPPCCGGRSWRGCWPRSGTSLGPLSSQGWWLGWSCPRRSGICRWGPASRCLSTTETWPSFLFQQHMTRSRWPGPPPRRAAGSSPPLGWTRGLGEDRGRGLGKWTAGQVVMAAKNTHHPLSRALFFLLWWPGLFCCGTPCWGSGGNPPRPPPSVF